MDRKTYVSDEVVVLCEYVEAIDDPDLYACWLDEDTQRGYNRAAACTFEEWSQGGGFLHRFIAAIVRRRDGARVGAIFLSPEGAAPDLAIMIYAPYRGMGYGTRAFSLGARYCFDSLSLDFVYAGCYPDNRASRKMLEKSGFQPHPEGDVREKHYLTGEDVIQLDFVKYAGNEALS